MLMTFKCPKLQMYHYKCVIKNIFKFIDIKVYFSLVLYACQYMLQYTIFQSQHNYKITYKYVLNMCFFLRKTYKVQLIAFTINV